MAGPKTPRTTRAARAAAAAPAAEGTVTVNIDDLAKLIDQRVAAATSEQNTGVQQTLQQIQASLLARPAVRPAADVDSEVVPRTRGTLVTLASSAQAAVVAASFAAFNYRAFLAAAKPFAHTIKRECERYGYPFLDAYIQIAHDSGFNPLAESNAGAAGIAQIMPDRAAAWKIDPLDADASIRALVINMVKYRTRFEKELIAGQIHGPSDPQARSFAALDLALAAYDSSPDAVEAAGGVPPASQNYVAMIGGTVRAVLSSSGNRAQWIEDYNALLRD